MMMDELERQSTKYFEMKDTLNKRVEEYTLLRMSFEYEKQKVYRVRE